METQPARSRHMHTHVHMHAHANTCTCTRTDNAIGSIYCNLYARVVSQPNGNLAIVPKASRLLISTILSLISLSPLPLPKVPHRGELRRAGGAWRTLPVLAAHRQLPGHPGSPVPHQHLQLHLHALLHRQEPLWHRLPHPLREYVCFRSVWVLGLAFNLRQDVWEMKVFCQESPVNISPNRHFRQTNAQTTNNYK